MIVCKDLYRLLMEYLLLQIKPPTMGEYFASLSSIEYCILHSKHHQTPPTCLAAITSPVPRSAARCDQPVPAPCVSSPRSRETKNTRLWSGLVMSSGKQGTSAALHQVKPYRVFANFCVFQFLDSAFPFMSVS